MKDQINQAARWLAANHYEGGYRLTGLEIAALGAFFLLLMVACAWLLVRTFFR